MFHSCTQLLNVEGSFLWKAWLIQRILNAKDDFYQFGQSYHCDAFNKLDVVLKSTYKAQSNLSLET